MKIIWELIDFWNDINISQMFKRLNIIINNLIIVFKKK